MVARMSSTDGLELGDGRTDGEGKSGRREARRSSQGATAEIRWVFFRVRSRLSGQLPHFNISRRTMLPFLADGFTFLAVGAHEFEVELEVHPRAGGDAEEAAQAQIVFRSAAAFALLH